MFKYMYTGPTALKSDHRTTEKLELGFNEYVHIRAVYYRAAPIGIFKSASFSERVLPISGFLSLPFLKRFPHMRCHIGNKMYISELFTVVGYLHTAGFKNHRGIIVPSV